MIFLPIGLFCVALISGGSIGILNRRRSGIGDGLIDVAVLPVAILSTISAGSLAAAAYNSPVAIGAGIMGFALGAAVCKRM